MGHAPAAGHALAVLRLLASRAAPLPAAAIARELGIPRSSLYRVLGVLTEQGFVAHMREQSRYGLGIAAFELGAAYTRQEPLRWLARTSLERLVAATREHGHFATLHGRDVLYLIEQRFPGRPPLVTDVGVRLPANLTASGLAMLGALPAAQVTALFPTRAAFTRRGSGGPASPAELRGVLAKVREQGHAEENGWVTDGFASVACPVLDARGHPLAAIALTFPAAEVGARRRREIAEQIRTAANEVARGARASR
jgi:DNA-binding IclR family transcriptional regulator